MQGSINSIESFGLVDGPGIRTVFFLNGCNLRCKYCHNPETWKFQNMNYTSDELVKKCLRYKPYFRRNNGGVTFSGGEPLLQYDFLVETCKKLKQEDIHIAIDTAGIGLGNYNELFENIEYPKGRNFEDIGTTYLLFEKSKKIVHIKNQYYAYVLRGNSITGKLSKKSLFDEIFLVNKRYNYLKEKFGNEVTKNLKINRLGLIIRYHMAVCKFLDKETFNSTDLQEEYKFFVNNYNEIGKLSNKQKILGKILYFNRNVFYLIMKFLYWMRGK